MIITLHFPVDPRMFFLLDSCALISTMAIRSAIYRGQDVRIGSSVLDTKILPEGFSRFRPGASQQAGVGAGPDGPGGPGRENLPV